MGIYDLKQELSDVPGIERLVMDYEPVTGWQLFRIGDAVGRVRPDATAQEIRAALLEALGE